MTSPQCAAGRLLAAAAAASVAVLVAPAAGAHAAVAGPRALPQGRLVLLRNVGTGDCLELSGEDLYTNSCSGEPTQLWLSDGRGELRNPDSGQCVQDFGNGDAHATECDGSPRQQWDDRGRNWLANQWTGACLADWNGYAYTTGCDNYPNERWIAEDVR